MSEEPTGTVEIAVESIAVGGDGVGRVAGVVVFIPRTAPGDLVRARITRRKRFWRGEVEAVLRSSPARVPPSCPHYAGDRCGGCQLQHLRYDAQLGAKGDMIRDSLHRIGRRTIELPRVVPSGREWRYRTKLTLALRRAPAGWFGGLHPYDDPVATFHLADCPITDERVLRIWKEVIAASTHFPDGGELRCAIRLVAGGATIVMEGGSRWTATEAFLTAVPSATAIWWAPRSGRRRLVAERVKADGGASFAQVNQEMGTLLHRYVVARAQRYSPTTVVDAYAGTGDTAVALAGPRVSVTAIEIDHDAAAYCASRLPPGSQSLTGRVEDLLSAALPADVILANPPRSGLHERVATALEALSHPPRALVYVSCDPATLARDLARMPRYRIVALRAFDLFPQTAHVETVCELVPEAR